MTAIAPVFIRKRYEMKYYANIRDIVFQALVEYNTIVHVHKKMNFFDNFEIFLHHYNKLRAHLRAFSSSIRALKAKREATLARESQFRASDDEMEWRASNLDNDDEADSVDEEDEKISIK